MLNDTYQTMIENIQYKLDEAVIMLNKRQLKSGIAMVQEARHKLDKHTSQDALREAAKEAEELLREVVFRKMSSQLPRENFWRECGATREKLSAALDNREVTAETDR